MKRPTIAAAFTLLLAASVPGQEPAEPPEAATRPSTSPAEGDGQARVPARRREGGFHGIWFTEILREGRPVLEVRSVLEGSDAERLGLRKGDLITAVNGERLRDGDHFIRMLYGTVPEFRRRMGGGRRPAEGEEGDEPRRNFLTVLRGGEEARIEGGLADLDATPRVGDPAPDFTLADPSGKNEVTLSRLVGENPVVLVFGSFT